MDSNIKYERDPRKPCKPSEVEVQKPMAKGKILNEKRVSLQDQQGAAACYMAR
jgi:hypothetical protein